MRLLSYKFKVIYKPGRTNVADPLSRLISTSQHQKETTEVDDNFVNWIVSYAEPKAVKLNEIAEESQKDEGIQAVKVAIHNGEWNNQHNSKTANPSYVLLVKFCCV